MHDMNEQRAIRVGTRASLLARTQTEWVVGQLRQAGHAVEIETIATVGDARTDVPIAGIGGDGVFVRELERALLDNRIDAAVHSLKDVPSDLAAGFVIAAVLPRAPIEDVLITPKPCTLETLPQGARVGTSSVRRAAQLKWLRPDVQIVEIRGNVPTRVKKVLGEQPLDAVLLAAAGLIRLGLMQGDQIHIEGQTISALTLDPVTFLPAAGQGAIAIECRAGDDTTIQALRALNDFATEAQVTVEREFLRLLGAGCQTPVGAHTWIKGDQMTMAVRVFNEADLSAAPVELEATGPVADPHGLAALLAGRLG